MPNWCDNTLNISHSDKTKLDELEAELSKIDKDGRSQAQLFEHFRPNPSGEWDYGWSIENWGTKWEASIIDWERLDEESMIIYFETAWAPPIAFYNFLLEDDWNIEAFYHESGMCFAGIYDNGSDDYYEYSDLTPDEIDEQFPHELNDMYGIAEQKRLWEEDQEEEEDTSEQVMWPEPLTEAHMQNALEELKAEFDRLSVEDSEENKKEK
jgi:hypothetical protein